MSDERLTELETKIAFQEDAVRALSDRVYEQQQQIDRLEAYCRRLLERVDSLSEAAGTGDPADEKPPHY